MDNFFYECGRLLGNYYGKKPSGFMKRTVNKFHKFVQQTGPYSSPEHAFKAFIRLNKGY